MNFRWSSKRPFHAPGGTKTSFPYWKVLTRSGATGVSLVERGSLRTIQFVVKIVGLWSIIVILLYILFRKLISSDLQKFTRCFAFSTARQDELNFLIAKKDLAYSVVLRLNFYLFSFHHISHNSIPIISFQLQLSFFLLCLHIYTLYTFRR